MHYKSQSASENTTVKSSARADASDKKQLKLKNILILQFLL